MNFRMIFSFLLLRPGAGLLFLLGLAAKKGGGERERKEESGEGKEKGAKT
jgi:hypothetical protein